MDVASRVRRYVAFYAPEKADRVAALSEKYAGRPGALFDVLGDWCGPEAAIERGLAVARAAAMRAMDPASVVACRAAEGPAVLACYDLSLRGRVDASVPTALTCMAAVATARVVAAAAEPGDRGEFIAAVCELIAGTPFNLNTIDLRCARCWRRRTAPRSRTRSRTRRSTATSSGCTSPRQSPLRKRASASWPARCAGARGCAT
jgi:hypothetical protein